MKKYNIISTVIIMLLLFTGCVKTEPVPESRIAPMSEVQSSFDITQVPAFGEEPYVAVNNNTPYFNESDDTSVSYEFYSDLDNLGRCGPASASIGRDLMPTEKRGSIGEVKPTGWHIYKYDFVDGKYLYNRCHLIGFQLSGENANDRNLITGTRYLNTQGMLPFENMVADYVKETNNHVLYRVTPIFEGENLIASGVLMEGWSIEDNGEGICFNVYAYNNQPGVEIDYVTGEAKLSEGEPVYQLLEDDTFIINDNTKKFHRPTCASVSNMKESNRREYTGNREELIREGYEPCKNCNP